jgi:hypothetical protein
MAVWQFATASFCPETATSHAQRKEKARQQKLNDMKLKLLGLTIFEIERDSADSPASARYSPRAVAAESPLSPPTTSITMRPFAELHQSAEKLPRTRRGTIDVEASLSSFGIKDPNALWQQRFKPGSAGAALKCILGAQGRKPGQSSRDEVSPELYTYPAEELPLVPETGKLDLAACFAMFDIREPAVLWKKRFRPNTAGGRIKMCMRASGFAPYAAADTSQPTGLTGAEKPAPSPQIELSPALVPSEDSLVALRRNAQGNIDIQASLHALGIADPKMLWRKRVDPGSAEHALKKEIARAMAKRETVPGITRQDIGLSN